MQSHSNWGSDGVGTFPNNNNNKRMHLYYQALHWKWFLEDCDTPTNDNGVGSFIGATNFTAPRLRNVYGTHILQ